jgi:sugar lactone lactonase YvrE
LPATQVSCPAFGGSDLTTLFVTTAYENLAKPSKFDGQTFFDEVDVVGQKEHQVKL